MMQQGGVKVSDSSLAPLGKELASCRICVERPAGPLALPHEPRPVCVLSSSARIAICGQAPGTRVHHSGQPYTDPSGDRLRSWMGIGKDDFYDAGKIAIVPMGFCFPGLDAKGGDKPPRRECRLVWHDRIFAAMPAIALKLVIGQYAIDYHLGELKRKTVRETVAAWSAVMTESRERNGIAVLPLPHPSWRNNAWIERNPWFEAEVVPVLRREIARLLAG